MKKYLYLTFPIVLVNVILTIVAGWKPGVFIAAIVAIAHSYLMLFPRSIERTKHDRNDRLLILPYRVSDLMKHAYSDNKKQTEEEPSISELVRLYKLYKSHQSKKL